jgi:hypothetical protein
MGVTPQKLGRTKGAAVRVCIDSHVHQQNIKPGDTGRGAVALHCDSCHQATNLPGAHIRRRIPSGLCLLQK